MVLDPSLSLQGENTISTSSVITPFWKTQSWFPSVGTPGGLPFTSTVIARSGSDANRSAVSNEIGSAPSDRLAYLRQSYSSQGFSSEASNLMLALWRDKTNSNYGSSFAKWASWCYQRDRNRLSGPIADLFVVFQTTNSVKMLLTKENKLCN